MSRLISAAGERRPRAHCGHQSILRSLQDGTMSHRISNEAGRTKRTPPHYVAGQTRSMRSQVEISTPSQAQASRRKPPQPTSSSLTIFSSELMSLSDSPFSPLPFPLPFASVLTSDFPSVSSDGRAEYGLDPKTAVARRAKGAVGRAARASAGEGVGVGRRDVRERVRRGARVRAYIARWAGRSGGYRGGWPRVYDERRRLGKKSLVQWSCGRKVGTK